VTNDPDFVPVQDTSDCDGDGLTNAEEAALGTNPDVADTDGDGLTDGEEVNTHGTNPTVADTDGDGVDDGTEIADGTDPLVDPSAASVPAAGLAGLALLAALLCGAALLAVRRRAQA
jgi:hypothetical protein